MIHDIIKEKVEAQDGMIRIPEGPGLGFTMNETTLMKFAKAI